MRRDPNSEAGGKFIGSTEFALGQQDGVVAVTHTIRSSRRRFVEVPYVPSHQQSAHGRSLLAVGYTSIQFILVYGSRQQAQSGAKSAATFTQTPAFAVSYVGNLF